MHHTKRRQETDAGVGTQATDAHIALALLFQPEHGLQQRLLQTMFWLKQQSQGDVRISRLRTHPGVGLLTALCVVHSLEPVSRFANARKVTAYAGLDPVERSSAERQRFRGIR